MSVIVRLCLFILFSMGAMASADLVSCGTVVAVEGNECESLRVVMDLSNCE